jgi:hypothetical protein
MDKNKVELNSTAMKKQTIILTILLAAIFQLVQSQDLTLNSDAKGSESNSKAIIWKNADIDLGSIEYNKPVVVAFEFTNNSDEPLVIKNVKTSCGCTAANYDNTVIKPGEMSKIEVTYNAKSQGFFSKTIDVTTSLKDESEKLTLKGTVN